MIRAWDIQFCRSPWLSLGFHVDHTDPSLTLHLPGVILSVGRLKQPGFRRCDHMGVETLRERRERLGLARRSSSYRAKMLELVRRSERES